MTFGQAKYFEDRITDRNARREFDGIVTSKVSSPHLRLMVQEMGTSGSVECITDASTWSIVRVGDLIHVRRGASNTAMRPYELGTPRAANVVGEDLSTRETVSHTTWETLLDVVDIEIPPGMPFRAEWHGEIETAGTPGAAEKQFRLVFNSGPEEITILLGSSDATIWLPWLCSTHSAGMQSPTRNALLLTATVSAPVFVPLETINRLTVQGRTNDTALGSDRLRASELVVST